MTWALFVYVRAQACLARTRALLAPGMNELHIGTDKAPILASVDVSSKFLLIDDGALIDALKIPERRKVERLAYRSTISTHCTG
jgi:hypothetical protein